MTKVFVILILVMFSISAKADIIFQDDFEGSIKPEWQGDTSFFIPTYGNAYHGQYSVTTLKQIDKVIYVDLAGYQQDTTCTCWFYDNGDSVYEALISVAHDYFYMSSYAMLSIGVDTEQSQSNYAIFEGWHSYNLTMARSIGWHRVDIFALWDLNEVYIDNELQTKTTFASYPRYVYLYANGWEGRQPDNPVYWDNILIYDGSPQPIPEPSSFIALIGGLSGLIFFKKQKR